MKLFKFLAPALAVGLLLISPAYAQMSATDANAHISAGERGSLRDFGLVLRDFTGGSLTAFGITATPTELNALDGITSSVGELNIVDGVTATAAEINLLDGAVSTGAVASKAAIFDADKDLVAMRQIWLGLNGASGFAGAINIQDGANPGSTAQLSYGDLAPVNAAATNNSTITIGAAAGTTQTASIQLKDGDDVAIAAVRHIEVYMATDATGATVSTSGAAAGVTVTTGKAIAVITAALAWDLVTDVNGVAVLTIDNMGGGGEYADYVVLTLPNGEVVVSAVLATPAA